MRLIIQVHQPLQTDPRIALRGRQTLVPQQLLHTAQIGTGIQQMGRERVPQGVGRDGLHARVTAQPFYAAHGFTAVEAAAPRAHEQGFLMFGSQRPPLLEPGPQCRHGRIRQR